MRDMHRATTQHRLQHSCTYVKFGEYAERFTLPKAQGSFTKLFDEDHMKRNISNGTFSSSSSQFLAIAPILKRYLERVVSQEVQGTFMEMAIVSMILALKVVLLCQAARRKGKVKAADLERAIARHLKKFVEVYGTDAMRAKHHYSMHLPLQLNVFGFLMAVFTHERKHRAAIRYGKGRMNLTTFDTSVLEECLCHNLWELDSFHRNAFSIASPSKRQLWCLQDLFPEFKDATFTMHQELYKNGYITAGDCVAFEDNGEIEFGELVFTVGITVDAIVKLVCFVKVWERGPEVDGCIDCKIQVDREMEKIDSSKLRISVTYAMSNDRTSSVVIAPPYV